MQTQNRHNILNKIFLIGSCFCSLFMSVSTTQAQILPDTAQTTVPAQQKSLTDKPYQISSLSFPWNMPVNMATFQREGKLWIIFDHPHATDIEELKGQAGNKAKNIFQLPHLNATVIHMELTPGTDFNVRREGLLWIVDLIQGREQKLIKEMDVLTQYDSFDNSYLYIPTEKSGNVVSVIDPDVGDIIYVGTIGETGNGVNKTYSYPEFDSLATKQGLAFVIKSPDINLLRGNTGFILKAQNRSLNISENLDNLMRQARFNQKDQSENPFDISVDPQIMEKNFIDAVDQLKQEIIAAKPENKNKIRQELIKYYISKGLGTNALYTLNQMEELKLPESKTESFHALIGLANFLTYRYEEAIKNFEYGRLPENQEAVFWRTLSSAAQEYKPENNVILASHLSLIRNYPQELKDRIAVIAAQNALRAGDDIALQNFIDILKSGEGKRIRDRSAETKFLNAQKLELQGYSRNAIHEYRNVSKLKDVKYSALARYNYTILSEKFGAMKLKQAIAELERLRFAWPEPNFKWELLNKLADLYIKDYDYYNALKTIQQSVPLAKDDEQKKNLYQKMVTWFEDVFINNQADSRLPVIKSLALYQDFEWLAEISPHKNEIIQKLADRLVAVDLLPRAYQLLGNLLSSENLSAIDTAKVGARMAIINLFENQPGTALNILNETERTNIPYEIQAHRRIIRAKALGSMNLSNEALKLLEDDNSKNALLLKCEIYWNSQQWAKFADTIKYLVKKPIPNQELEEEQIAYILDWATALKKSGKETVLVRLRNKFMPYFEKTKYHGAFNVLTDYMESDTIDIKHINQLVNEAKAYSDFAKVYNELLKDSIQ